MSNAETGSEETAKKMRKLFEEWGWSDDPYLKAETWDEKLRLHEKRRQDGFVDSSPTWRFLDARWTILIERMSQCERGHYGAHTYFRIIEGQREEIDELRHRAFLLDAQIRRLQKDRLGDSDPARDGESFQPLGQSIPDSVLAVHNNRPELCDNGVRFCEEGHVLTDALARQRVLIDELKFQLDDLERRVTALMNRTTA